MEFRPTVDTERDQTATARERANEIRARIDSLTENLGRIPVMVQAAHDQQDWKALGYQSWPDYVHAEYGTALLRLSNAVRKEWCQRLAAGGLSTRAIAPVVNASFKTVARDLESVSNDTGGAVDFRIMPRLRWHREGSRLALNLGEYRAAVRELAGIYPEELQPYIIQVYEDFVISNVYVLGKSQGIDLDRFNRLADEKLQRAIGIAEKLIVAWLEDNP
jgi:hypothetical protein